MSWKMRGTYFENCNCQFACPCSVTSFAAPGTEERCQVVLVYNVESGEGGWRLGLFIDDKASPQQTEKPGAVFGAQAGGPMANLGPLVGEVMGIERAAIEYSNGGRRHSARIGSDIEIEVEDFVPEGQPEPTRLQGVNHPSNSTLTIGRPTRSRIKAFGMEFHNEGRSAFSAPFSWSA